MSESNEERNAALYLLAGVGLGALIGVAAGMLFAPKAGAETRDELSHKFQELKAKTEGWIAEHRAKGKEKLEEVADAIGA
ncbi:MAG: YtxH domain-containing protein [Fimbriimonadaceae bacterium]|nr:YtxH domain-containing protein [Fimbriimonadaceae bacterium]